MNNKFVLVVFYATWCKSCEALALEFTSAATKLKQRGSPAILAKLEATENSVVIQSQNIVAYPTIKWFVNGKETVFEEDASIKEDRII